MPAPTRRLLACATSIAAAVGLLAGCTGATATVDPTPSPATTSAQPASSATPSAAATASAPQWSATMDEVSADGALAVGQYFLELYPYVVETGDVTEWSRLSDPECIFCRDTADFASSKVDAADDLVTVDVSNGRAEEVDPGSYYALTFDMTSEVPGQDYVEESVVQMGVLRSDSRWVVRAVDVVLVETP